MAGEEGVVSTPLLENILNQAQALREVLLYQSGEGQSDLELAAGLVKSNKRIILSGMGASYFACLPLCHALVADGIDASAIETSELLYFPPAWMDNHTLVVLVSRSGESIEATKVLGRLGTRGINVLSVVNVPESTLAKSVGSCILLRSPADQLVAIQTYIATIAVLELLQSFLENEMSHAKRDLEQAADTLDGSVVSWVKNRSRWNAFLEGSSPIYLLSRGPGLASALQGALLMHETARFTAIGMSIPQFRHGPVEVVDKDFRAVIIGTQAETVELDVALANDLMAMGGQVRWLGPEVASCRAEALCEWPTNIPARFAAIAEVIPLQILAYAKAELRGLRPGEFRWATPITTSEAGFKVTA